MNKASFTVEIDAKPNTQEYSDKMFSAMAECMKELTKYLYIKNRPYSH